MYMGTEEELEKMQEGVKNIQKRTQEEKTEEKSILIVIVFFFIQLLPIVLFEVFK